MGDDTDTEDSPLPMSSSESQSQSQAQTSLTLWGDQEPQSQSLLSPMSSPPTPGPAQTRRPPLHSRQTTLDGFGTSAAAGTSRSHPLTSSGLVPKPKPKTLFPPQGPLPQRRRKGQPLAEVLSKVGWELGMLGYVWTVWCRNQCMGTRIKACNCITFTVNCSCTSSWRFSKLV